VQCGKCELQLLATDRHYKGVWVGLQDKRHWTRISRISTDSKDKEKKEKFNHGNLPELTGQAGTRKITEVKKKD